MCYIDKKKPAAMEERAGEEGNCGVAILISYIFGTEESRVPIEWSLRCIGFIRLIKLSRCFNQVGKNGVYTECRTVSRFDA